MAWSTTYREDYGFAFKDESDYEGYIPKSGEEIVGKYVGQLWEDGKKYLENAFAPLKDGKGIRFGFNTPEDFWDACQKLENGQHYEVFPARNQGVGNSWKQELVDNEIQKQIRAKKNHITSNWHEITISPNIAYLNEIITQGHKATGWSEQVRQWVAYAQTYGNTWIRSILDKTENPKGEPNRVTCQPGAVLLTPESKSIKKIDGCWYAVHGQRVNNQWVKKNYPKIDLTGSQGSTPSFFKIGMTQKEYTHTKLFNMLEMFCDDDAFEEIPFTQEEFDQRIGLLMEGVQVPGAEAVDLQPQKEDNHKKYIKAYTEWLEEKVDYYNQAEENGLITRDDLELIQKIMQIVDSQLMVHAQILEDSQKVDESEKIPAGKRKKYPFGRYVVTINGVVADDLPNPYNFEWRRLFHNLVNEKVPGRVDGRGDVEILWQDNKILDTMLSRHADDGLLAMYRKPWFKVSEKKQIEEEGVSVDPTVPGYFIEQPPTFAASSSNSNYLESYKIVKNGIKELLGVNNVTRGESSFSGESGDHAEALISQNVTMVAGELNLNLNDVIEDIVETEIMILKEFSVEPTIYTIDGQQVELVVSDHLKQMSVIENGQEVFKEIPQIEVSVRPESNFPNRDESELRTLVQLSKVMNEDGLPIIPSDMILDYIGRKFPSLATSGKYRKELQLLALGKQAAAQMQAQQQQQQKPLDDIMRKAQQRMTSEAAAQIAGNGSR